MGWGGEKSRVYRCFLFSFKYCLVLQNERLKTEGGSVSSAAPDVCIAYKLHLECGRLINLYDWLEVSSPDAWQQVAFCYSCTAGFYWPRRIDRWPLSVMSGPGQTSVCFQAYTTVVTAAEGTDTDSFGKVDEIKQYPFVAFLWFNRKRKKKTSLRNVAPQLAPQRSFHPGRIGARVPGFHQVHEAEDRPRGSTHLGRLLTDPIHPSIHPWLQ